MATTAQPGSELVSIVVADATRIHTQLLADALRSDPSLHVVAAASNSQELLASITRVPIDVAVISRNLDDLPGRGTEVLREMRALRPQIKGVILLDASGPQYALECFRAGARGIFSKQERVESLGQCIRDVHQGQIWARSADLDHALAALANSPQARSTNYQGLELLSAREREVVQYLSSGMTNREIAQQLQLSPHTVKNYLFKIFDKLGVSSRTELLSLAMTTTTVAAKPTTTTTDDALVSQRASGGALLEAAEAGDPPTQLRMGDQCSSSDTDAPGELVSAYMWYLLAEAGAAKLLEQSTARKKTISATMTAEQIAEATRRADEWRVAHSSRSLA